MIDQQRRTTIRSDFDRLLNMSAEEMTTTPARPRARRCRTTIAPDMARTISRPCRTAFFLWLFGTSYRQLIGTSAMRRPQAAKCAIMSDSRLYPSEAKSRRASAADIVEMPFR